MRDLIKYAQSCLSSLEKRLDETPNVQEIEELIDACKDIDARYREICLEHDEDEGLEAGTTWKDGGWGAEFYIDDSIWADASKALEKLIEKKETP